MTITLVLEDRYLPVAVSYVFEVLPSSLREAVHLDLGSFKGWTGRSNVIIFFFFVRSFSNSESYLGRCISSSEDDIDDLSRDCIVDDDNVNDTELLFDSPIGERLLLSWSQCAGASTNEMNYRPIRPPSDVRLAKRLCPGAFTFCTYW